MFLVVCRTGTYEIQEAEGVQPGTKIVLHLKQESREFSDEDTVSGMLLHCSVVIQLLHIDEDTVSSILFHSSVMRVQSAVCCYIVQ